MAPKGQAPHHSEKPLKELKDEGFISNETGNYVPPNILNDYKVPRMGERYTGVLGDNFLNKPLFARLNWLHVPLICGSPFLALYGIFTAKWYWQTIVFTISYYLWCGIGITGGYHRLFAHRAYKAHPILKLFFLAAGTAAVEGSVRWWCRDHRAHHKYVDTDKDPYAAIKGFWYAHVGWMLVKQDKEKIGYADISDLSSDPWIRFQHRYYLPLAAFFGFIFPALVCGYFWGDYFGGFITAMLTLGEGYHNFHHEFPSDYRNGIEWYQYDPTKMFIKACAWLGLAYDLQEFPQNEIDKGKLQMEQKFLDGKKGRLYWGPDPRTLPVITKADLKKRVDAGEKLVILDGFVLNLKEFIHQHPGGEKLITTEIGQDVTEKFKTTYYKHSNAARNLSSTFRVARLEGYWA